MTTKEKILSAVARVFFQDGVESLTMKRVAEEAGIGKSTVYEYFESKDKMIADAIIYASNAFLEQFYKSWSVEDMNFDQALRVTIDRLIMAFKNELGRFIRMMEEFNAGGHKDFLKEECEKELLDLHAKSIEYTKKLLVRGVDEGYIRDDIIDLDVVNFQRTLILLCAPFSEKNPLIAEYASKVEKPEVYVYEHMMRLYGA